MTQSASTVEQEVASHAVDVFVNRFEPSYRLLAYYASFPLILTPDLLNFLRNRFLRAQVPWVAEVDLLLSDLCREVGYEQYAMRAPIRAQLVAEAHRNLGAQRVQQVAEFLLHYVGHAWRTDSSVGRRAVQAQQWAAMAYLDDRRGTVVNEIVVAFHESVRPSYSGIGGARESQAEIARLIRLTHELAPQLQSYPQLLEYADEVSQLLAAQSAVLVPDQQVSSVDGRPLPRLEQIAKRLRGEDDPQAPRATLGPPAGREAPVEQPESDWIQVYGREQFASWDRFDTTGRFAEHIRIRAEGGSEILELSTTGPDLVGVNRDLGKVIVGHVLLEYQVVSSSVNGRNICFFMIPMQASNEVVEVGAEVPEDARDGTSPYRVRRDIPADYVGDNQWHSMGIRFDFQSTPSAALAVFAPRINEGCLETGAATVAIRNVRFFAPSESPNGPTAVFISYARQDEKLRHALETHLDELRRQGLINVWDDRRIAAGSAWTERIDEHINAATVILLLVSPDFLASQYCLREAQRAMERHDAGEAVVIPVILRPVHWQGAPFGKLPALPMDGRPISSRRNRELAFLDVAQGIRKAIEMRQRLGPSQGIWHVPQPRTPNFTDREVLLQHLRTAFTAGRRKRLTQALVGIGGVGKTEIANEYAYRHARDYELVWWLRAEESATLSREFALLAHALDLPEQEESNQVVVVGAVHSLLGELRNWLLIFDDVGEPADVRPYLPQDGDGHVLITSRNPDWGESAQIVSVQAFGRADAVAFLLKRTGLIDAPAAELLAEKLGDLPSALEQAATAIEGGWEIADYLDYLRNQYASCFISYSSRDQPFVERLREDLQQRGVRCWFAPQDLPIGAKTRPAIGQAISTFDRLLLVLSKSSVASMWVEKEVQTALEKELETRKVVLFPVRVDNAIMTATASWAQEVRETRNIGDMRRWRNQDAYQRGFERLLRDLRTDSAVPPAPAPRAAPRPVNPMSFASTVDQTGEVASDPPGTALEPGATIRSVVDYMTKPNDVFSVPLVAGARYQFAFLSTDGLGSNPVSVQLMNPDLSVAVAGAVDSSGCAWSGSTDCSFMPVTSGTYYFRVTALGAAQRYTFTLKRL